MSSTSIHHYQNVQATIANRYIHDRDSMHLPRNYPSGPDYERVSFLYCVGDLPVALRKTLLK